LTVGYNLRYKTCLYRAFTLILSGEAMLGLRGFQFVVSRKTQLYEHKTGTSIARCILSLKIHRRSIVTLCRLQAYHEHQVSGVLPFHVPHMRRYY
jgi:hypothetical protein